MNIVYSGTGRRALVLAVALSSGCASVQNEATRNATAEAVATGPKPSVQLVLTDDVAAALTDVAEQATRDSGLFGPVSAAPKPALPADLTIKLGLTSQRRAVSDAETVWGMTTAILFTVYPSTCARDEYELVADVSDRSGRRLKSYDLRDTETSWLWLLHGENCGSVPAAERVKAVANGLLQTLYRDIGEDRLLATANTAPAAADDRPRVYVTANRAGDIVQRVALTSAPYAQFVFDDKEAREADFTLDIDLGFGSSDQTLVRTMAGIMSLALVSPCSATTFSLKAKLSDRSGKQVRSYDLSDSYRSIFDGSRGCRAVDEGSRPEEVAEFVGKLFARMQRDRVFEHATAAKLAE
ncbi:MAG: hypothetical protein WCA09_17385 [Burkholderiales bacterium]